MWKYDICDTVSGAIIGEVKPASGSWERVMNGTGGGTHEFVLSSLGQQGNRASFQRIRRALTAPNARTLVQSWDGQVTYAGFITHRKMTDKSDKLVVRHSEIREIFKKRFTFGENGYQGDADPKTGDIGAGRLSIVNNSVDSLVGWLIWQGMQGIGPNWSLPLIPPPRNVPGPHKRVWWDYNFPVVESEMTELQNAYGGPDIEFKPQWSASNTLEWQSRVGKLDDGKMLDWNTTAERPRALDIEVEEDSTKTGNMMYALGDGQERDMLVRKAKADTAQPALERVENYSQLKDLDWLQSHVDADLQTFRTPTEQVTWSIQAGDNPGIRDLVLGQRVRLYFKNHNWFDDGWHDYRLIAFRGDLTETVRLETQPYKEAA